jgi:hypothetical protein
VGTAQQADEIKKSLPKGSKSFHITNFDVLQWIFPDFLHVSNSKSCTEMITSFFVRNIVIEITEFLRQIRASSKNCEQDKLELPSPTLKARNTLDSIVLEPEIHILFFTGFEIGNGVQYKQSRQRCQELLLPSKVAIRGAYNGSAYLGRRTVLEQKYFQTLE